LYSRQPAQVFILLETIFGAFDEIAKKRRIFKVETVGDCYVAVAGLPERRRVSESTEDVTIQAPSNVRHETREGSCSGHGQVCS
jgi:Adenylate and Guanylate cyclase catalytic domain